MPKAKELPVNCAARNAVRVYPRVVSPRFPGAPAMVETTGSYQMPDISAPPDGTDMAVELYGRAYALRPDGENNRLYVRRLHYASFASREEARRAFIDLWREVERLGSVGKSCVRPGGGWSAGVRPAPTESGTTSDITRVGRAIGILALGGRAAVADFITRPRGAALRRGRPTYPL